MITISLCMIVKNEEDTIARCLDSINDLVDEIIIVDTGSNDSTKEIVRRYTNNIYDFEWVDDFSIARNYSFSKATKEYCMWLDADDVLLEADRQKFKLLKQTLDPIVDTVIMKYNMGTRDDGSIACTFCRERLVKRSNNFKWHDPVHEYIIFSGNFLNSEVAITHKKIHPPSKRNLEIFEKYIEKGNELSERNWFYYARELRNFQQIDKAIIYYNKFLATSDGLMSNYLDSCIDLSECYHIKNDSENELKTLLRYFEYDVPRAEILCKVGYYHKEKGDYEKAKIWFEIATKSSKPTQTWGSVMHQYWDYIPYMELCSCAYKLGDIDGAIAYNQQAALAKPNDEKILHNRIYLATIKQKLVERHLNKAKATNNLVQSTGYT